MLDTNKLLDSPELLESGNNFVILSIVLRELENLERKKDQKALQFQIREAKRAISKALKLGKAQLEHTSSEAINGYSETYADNIILNHAYKNHYGIATNDLLLRFKANTIGVPLYSEERDTEVYNGYKEIEMTKEDLDSLIFQHLDKNIFNLNVNEYLIVKDPDIGVVLALLKWTGEWLENITDKKGNIRKGFTTDMLGKVVAKDAYQVMAMDSIESNQVTMLRGRAGSGKTFLAVNEAWRLVENEGYRLVVFFNPAPSLNSVELGFMPGTLTQKFLSCSGGNMLKAKFGGEDILVDRIMHGQIEILPFVDLRGWDSSGETPAVVLILESQNLSVELLKMGLQRVDEKSKVIIDGDFDQQIDKAVYEQHNGMRRASEVLRGWENYGEVRLKNVYRSKLADIVDAM